MTARPAAELAAVHALAWLAGACAVGLLLATLLLAPALPAGPAYGRWVPVHLDLALYGWCGLSLVALLCRAFLPPSAPQGAARLAVHAWSGSLAAGAASWLAGESTGKEFLEWTGAARALFLAALVVLGLALLDGLRRRRAEGARPGVLLLGLAAWIGLMAVPVVMAVATDPAVYPPINPDSSGPTGGSLLGSTLGVLAVFLAAPLVLGVRADRRALGWAGAALGVHLILFALLDHGDHAHGEPAQIAAVASLAPWGWLLPRTLSRCAWPGTARRWLGPMLLWWTLLLGTAILVFLPGVLEAAKFTHVLVAHAHLAMAGLASAFALLALATLLDGGPLREALADRPAFSLWNAGLGVHVAALAAAGAREAAVPGVLFRPDAPTTALYLARWAAGAAMLAAAVRWTARAVRGAP